MKFAHSQNLKQIKQENIRNLLIVSPLPFECHHIIYHLQKYIIVKPFIGDQRWDSRQPFKQSYFHQYYYKTSTTANQDQQYFINIHFTYLEQNCFNNFKASSLMYDGAFLFIDCLLGVTDRINSIIIHLLCQKIKFVIVVDNLDMLVKQKLSTQQIIRKINQISEEVRQTVQSFTGDACHEYNLLSDLFIIACTSEKFNFIGSNQFLKACFSKKHNCSFSKKHTPLNQIQKMNEDLIAESIQLQFMKKEAIELILQFITLMQNKQYVLALELIQSINKTECKIRALNNYNTCDNTLMQIGRSLFQTAINCLPSPIDAQILKKPAIFQQQFKLSQTEKQSNQQRLNAYISGFYYKNRIYYAITKIISGSITVGDKVKIITYAYGKLQINEIVINQIMIKGHIYHYYQPFYCNVKVAERGSIVLILKHKVMNNNCFIVDINCQLERIKEMADIYWNTIFFKRKYCPTFKYQVVPKKPQQLPQLFQALRSISRCNNSIQVKLSDATDIYQINGNIFTVKNVFKELTDLFQGQIVQPTPIFIYREVPTVRADQIMIKSQNRHNRLYATAEPIGKQLVQALQTEFYPKQDNKQTSELLVQKYGWDEFDSKQIWSFGPGQITTNFLVNQTKAVKYLYEIKQPLTQSFNYTLQNGMLCEEFIQGLKVNLTNLEMICDAIHRGRGQILPAARRLYFGLELKCEPILYEPQIQFKMLISEQYEKLVYKIINEHFGVILNMNIQNMPNKFQKISINGTVALKQYSNLQEKLNKAIKGKCLLQIVRQYWGPYEPAHQQDSMIDEIMKIRKRKGLELRIKTIDQFQDKL